MLVEIKRCAVIDVGTNSVKLLVADVSGPEVLPIYEGSRQTRLGKGLYHQHRLSAEAIASTAQAVEEFAKLAVTHGAETLRIIATSAARDASNARELTSALETASGSRVEIISGDQEAVWAFRGVTSDPRYARRPLLLLELGGGSTQFILGNGNQVHFRESFRLGTVRLLEKLPHSDPPLPRELAACRKWLCDFIEQEVGPKLSPALCREGATASEPALLVGTGGTATILARMEEQMDDYDRERIEAVVLSAERLNFWTEYLWGMPLELRKRVSGLPSNRADVILNGVLVFQTILSEFRFPELRISTRGTRFAALMQPGRKGLA
jgi:exopolyphosphatase/guanosine-5'-triphosphate,3'-diphosphate pyrophosphatase